MARHGISGSTRNACSTRNARGTRNTRGTERRGFTPALFATLLASLLALAVAATTPLAHAADKPTAYGKKLIQENTLPADKVAEFNAAISKSLVSGGDSAFMQVRDWSGEEFDGPSAGNPYTVVIKVSGTAVGPGDVGLRWQPYWNAKGVIMRPMIKSNAAAGDLIQMEAAAPPVSFKEDRKIAPVISLAAGRNIRLDSVKVEIWSGVGKASFLELLFAWSPLLIGVVFLSLAIWWRRR